MSGSVYELAWIDANQNGLVDAGAAFTLTLLHGSWPKSGTPMRLNLYFWDSAPLAAASWTA